MALIIEEPIFAALESTYGTIPTIAGSDAILVVGDPPDFDPLGNAVSSDRNAVRALTNARLAPRVAGAAPTFNFRTELKGSGAAGTAPRIGRLLRACGFVETVNAGVSVVYTLRANNTTYESLAVYHWKGPVRYGLAGGRGTFSIVGENSENLAIEFQFTFQSLIKGDVAQLTPTFETTGPLPFLAADFLTLGGANPAFTSFGLDLQQEIPIGRNANSASGVGSIRCGARQIQVTLNPQKSTLATKDWLADVLAGTSSALSLALGSAGNQVTIAMPKLVPSGLGFGDTEGLRTEDMTFIAEDNAAVNDELTITFT